jgi:CheY-like chemotaxis protein
VPKTVLLADDSITIQRVVALTFANEDVRIVSVGDGDQAIAAINQSAPDLVLADIGMPGRNGYEVAAYIRSHPRLSSLPVLLLAGAFEPVDATQAHQAGADGILTKPFDPPVLIGRVNELLTTGRAGAASQSVPPSVPFEEAPHSEAPFFAGAPVSAGTNATQDTHPTVPMVPVLPAGETAPPAPLPPMVPVPEAATRTDEYFDQIDQAFAVLARTPRPPLPPESDDDATGDGDPDAAAVPALPAASAPVGLTDAFAALLDAERAGTPEVPVGRVVLAASPSAVPGVDVNALADLIARRVLEQLTDRVVRETVAEIVTSSAERLVREEIDRIKRHIP